MIDGAVLAILNHLLGQAGWARQRLAPFAGRQARLAMPPWRLCLRVTEDGWLGAAADDTTADVEIALPAEAPVLAPQGIDRLLQAARIQGNAQFAAALSDVLQNLRWDYEEDLARVFGDIAAHRLAGGIAAFAGWQKRAAASAVRGFAASAAEKFLARRGDQQGLRDGIAELREALDRQERRLAALAGAAVHTR